MGKSKTSKLAEAPSPTPECTTTAESLNCADYQILDPETCMCGCDDTSRNNCINLTYTVNPQGDSTLANQVVWDGDTCSCNYNDCTDVNPGIVDSCLANSDLQFWNGGSCSCDCSPCGDESVIQDETTCACDQCKSAEDMNCSDGQIAIYDSDAKKCECGCDAELETKCTGESTKWVAGTCACICEGGNCKAGQSNQLIEGSCECKCKSHGDLGCGDHEVVVENIDSGCTCECDPDDKKACLGDDKEYDSNVCSCIHPMVDLKEGQTVFDISIQEKDVGKNLHFKNPDDSTQIALHKIIAVGSAVIAEPGLEEDVPSADVTIEIPTIPPASTQSDPHVKTFFGESYDL